MKYRTTSILFFFLTILFSLTASANTQENVTSTINVTGHASVKVVPDLMRWQLTLKSTHSDLAQTVAMQNENTKQLLRTLKKHDVKEKEVQTDRAVFGENWKWQANERIKQGYVATTNISFNIYDFDKYEKLWTNLAEIKGIEVSNTQYDVIDDRKYQSKARKLAVLDAKNKARELSEPLGAKVGMPFTISEMNHFSQAPAAFSLMESESIRDRSQSPMSVGTINIVVNVNVRFYLESP